MTLVLRDAQPGPMYCLGHEEVASVVQRIPKCRSAHREVTSVALTTDSSEVCRRGFTRGARRTGLEPETKRLELNFC